MLQKIKIVPQSAVFAFDLMICVFSFILSYFIRNNLSIDVETILSLRVKILILTIINIISFSGFRTYSGIIRYTGIKDVIKIFYSLITSIVFLFLISYISVYYGGIKIFLNTILVIYFLISFLLMVSYRELGKFLFHYIRNYNMDRKTVVIYGAGEAGYATKRVLEHDTKSNIQIAAFLDDDPRKVNKIFDGIQIINSKQFSELCRKTIIDELIFASFTISAERKNYIVDLCLDYKIKLMNVPPLNRWVNGQFSSRQLKNLQIEKLLERDPIDLNNKQIETQLRGMRILVTGAAGSIGSEIVRQLLKFSPEVIVLCDQAETPMHDLTLELNDNAFGVKCVPFLADVCNYDRMDELFCLYKPQYVYHAAAYKHVPVMEYCPQEAVLTNVYGTKLIADLSFQYNVSRFVMVSTDKAVNPTNVMGASKRLAEIYIEYLHQQLLKDKRFEENTKEIKYIITRFGNVLGSAGSVINRFREQIENGGPVTVTDPNMTRYFMTIPEASQLVLEAGSMGSGGEIFVFDMGNPVLISDLAKKMIRLYGYIPGDDIKIEFTGIRPGEKLFEELLMDSENTVPTYNSKITIARVREVQLESLDKNFELLFHLARQKNSTMHLVALMKEMIPEFLSNNSQFEILDSKKAI